MSLNFSPFKKKITEMASRFNNKEKAEFNRGFEYFGHQYAILTALAEEMQGMADFLNTERSIYAKSIANTLKDKSYEG